jgi:hypothetical protein
MCLLVSLPRGQKKWAIHYEMHPNPSVIRVLLSCAQISPSKLEQQEKAQGHHHHARVDTRPTANQVFSGTYEIKLGPESSQ